MPRALLVLVEEQVEASQFTAPLVGLHDDGAVDRRRSQVLGMPHEIARRQPRVGVPADDDVDVRHLLGQPLIHLVASV